MINPEIMALLLLGTKINSVVIMKLAYVFTGFLFLIGVMIRAETGGALVGKNEIYNQLIDPLAKDGRGEGSYVRITSRDKHRSEILIQTVARNKKNEVVIYFDRAIDGSNLKFSRTLFKVSDDQRRAWMGMERYRQISKDLNHASLKEPSNDILIECVVDGVAVRRYLPVKDINLYPDRLKELMLFFRMISVDE